MSQRFICRAFSPLNFPEIVDTTLPADGVFHNLVFVCIKTDAAVKAKVENLFGGVA